MFLVTIIILQVTAVYTSPIQLQMLQPFLQPQMIPLQESAMMQQIMPSQQKQQYIPLLQQLLAMQLQALQRMNMQAPVTETTPLQRPLLILLPKIKTVQQIKTASNPEHLKSHHGIVNEESDSIVIDAEPNPIEKEEQKGILLIPNEGRLSIGGIISNIPFLPIEVNVPDSISWIYNGIAGIISGIGQRWPFQPQVDNMEQGMQMRNPQTKTMTPVLLVPLG